MLSRTTPIFSILVNLFVNMKMKGILWCSLLAYVTLVSAYPDNPSQPSRPLLNLRAGGGRLEDPANPVAAAATDPNEAAMNIKSRDLLPSNRADIHPHHRDPSSSGGRRHEEDDDDDDSGGKPPSNGNRKGGSGNGNLQQKHGSKNHGNDSENDDGGDDGDRSSKGKSGKSAPKDKNKKSSSSSQSKSKNKTTHTGIDGKEVADDDEDSDASKKKVKVKHVESKKHRWRTGKPKYDYKKALAGWKEVGPMYYYKGKYANDATAAATSAHILLVSIAFAALMGFLY